MKLGQRTKKADATKELIYECAIELFRSKGFENTTMREIAASCELATSASYYYFQTKEHVILEFYRRSQDQAGEFVHELISKETDFRVRLQKLIEQRFDALSSQRALVRVLSRSAMDVESPLSPFSPTTIQLRKDAIELHAKIIQGTKLKLKPELEKRLPKFLWIFQMGLIFLWVHDQSPNQRRTRKLMEQCIPNIMNMLTLLRIPIVRSIIGSLLDLVDTLDEFMPAKPNPNFSPRGENAG